MDYDVFTDSRTADVPATISIELSAHGSLGGECIDFEMYSSLLGQLQKPERIRLICESDTDFPVIEAIDLAKATGASPELVSSCATFSAEFIGELATSGLDRLIIALDHCEPAKFKLHDVTAKVKRFMSAREEVGRATPAVILSVSASSAALSQLKEIARQAHSLGIVQISLHPDMQRDVAQTPTFSVELRQLIQEITKDHPSMSLQVIAQEPEDDAILDATPRYLSGRLPEGASILTCDQDPWDSVRILPNGDVVTCAIRDSVKLGTVREQQLSEIWNGEEYRRFRRAYVSGLVDECRECPLKMAYLPSRLRPSSTLSDLASDLLISGWYSPDRAYVWSEPTSIASLRDVAGGAELRVRGRLPSSLRATPNVLTVDMDGEAIGSVVNDTHEVLRFDRVFSFVGRDRDRTITFKVSELYQPSKAGHGTDQRELGFALEHLEIAPN